MNGMDFLDVLAAGLGSFANTFTSLATSGSLGNLLDQYRKNNSVKKMSSLPQVGSRAHF